MEEIQVGEYVRTDKGYIEKIKDFKPHYTKGKRIGKDEEVIENFLLMGAKQCKLIESIDYSIPPCYPSDEELEKIKKHIIKHSKNIIDLIEEGDYVNGCKVHSVDEDCVTVYLEVGESAIDYNYIFAKDIKSIVTREMYESIKYEV